jgi:RND family efflux transporter MFP subunit
VNEWDEFSGRLEAVEKVEVRPRVSGYIEAIHFREGKEVKKGDLLFVIDPRSFAAELKRAEADLVRVKAGAELARSQRERAGKLLQNKFISQQDYDERINGLRAADANVLAAQAALDVAHLNMEFTRVTAPIDGRVGRAEITVGNLVGAEGPSGATLLTTIMSLDPIYAYFEGDEQIYLKYMELAQSGVRPSSREVRNPIYLGLANEEGYPHLGYMDFVDNKLDPATGTIRARAVFDNKERLFTPGLFARLKLVGSGKFKAVLINDRAVGTDQNQKFVLVLGAQNKVDYRPVKIGRLIEGLRVVKEGLKPGELIVVNGLQRVRPGMPVTPQTVPMEGEPAQAAVP